MNSFITLTEIEKIVLPEYGTFQLVSAALYTLAAFVGAFSLCLSTFQQYLMITVGTIMTCDELFMLHECITSRSGKKNQLFILYGLTAVYFAGVMIRNYFSTRRPLLFLGAFIGIFMLTVVSLDWRHEPWIEPLEEIGEAVTAVLIIIWLFLFERSFQLRRIPLGLLLSLAVFLTTAAATLEYRPKLCPKIDAFSHYYWFKRPR